MHVMLEAWALHDLPSETWLEQEDQDELLMILGSADASDGSNDQRFQISPNVYAADASLAGGGAYVSALCPRTG